MADNSFDLPLVIGKDEQLYIKDEGPRSAYTLEHEKSYLIRSVDGYVLAKSFDRLMPSPSISIKVSSGATLIVSPFCFLRTMMGSVLADSLNIYKKLIVHDQEDMIIAIWRNPVDELIRISLEGGDLDDFILVSGYWVSRDISSITKVLRKNLLL